MEPRIGERIIGRDHPAGLLRAAVDRAVASHGGLVLVAGEPGIGKTTLVTAAADEARQRGALVLGAACWDSDSAPGYWPWVQVMRGLRRSADDWALARESSEPALRVLLGEDTGAGTGSGSGSGPADLADGDHEAFALYDAVTTALVSVSQRRPVIVVLDDLHWADPASMRLLRFATQHTWFERLLVIGTYRDAEVESAEHRLHPLLMPLTAKATTVTLTGLSRAEVGALISRTAGREPDAELLSEVHRRTGGNPFFVEQTARLWRAGGQVTTIAPGVRQAVQRRLAELPDAVVEVLTVAAVLGRDFHRQVLAACMPGPVAQVDRLLDRAVTARLVAARGEGRFTFAHDLVRETLYDALPDDDRRARHAAVVRAVDLSGALAERLIPADLARHAWLAGGALGRPAPPACSPPPAATRRGGWPRRRRWCTTAARWRSPTTRPSGSGRWSTSDGTCTTTPAGPRPTVSSPRPGRSRSPSTTRCCWRGSRTPCTGRRPSRTVRAPRRSCCGRRTGGSSASRTPLRRSPRSPPT
ncbi:AAA family ATPase [Dactylosporangium sp. NBC_01737]|uniref:ATP-binding protein n=1 Tax=Dactylosporangium sp. NBC_01737 TaxID=2975959 RepID=UPI002E0FDB0E|nr:AAA family ATPase [Dactylosporangium sp. NBC_01737]